MISKKELWQAINEMCKTCIYDSYSKGTWREQVAECTAVKCPLYDFRPMPRTTKRGKQVTNNE